MSQDLYIQEKIRYDSGTYAIGRPGILSTATGAYTINRMSKVFERFDYVAQGNGFFIGILNGELYSWGTNSNGVTGLGVTTNTTLIPTQIGSDTDWTFCAAGNTCAGAIRGGRLYTWGSNSNGQTGQGTSTGTTTSPTQIGSDTDWEMVAFSTSGSVAIKAGKILSCGNNSNGRLGQGLAANAGTIVNVFTELDGGSTGWTYCSAGSSHIIGIKSGDIWGAGANANGRMGVSGSGNSITIVSVTSSADYVKCAAGSTNSFAIKSSGALFGTGLQSGGGLGDGGSGTLTAFTQIGSDTDWQDISCSFQTGTGFSPINFARKGGYVWGCGNNAYGSLGLYTYSSQDTWIKLSDIPVATISREVQQHLSLTVI